MRLIQICEGCGEEYLTHRGSFCPDCSIVPIIKNKSPVVLKQTNERNRESKLREQYKKRRKYQRNAKVQEALSG